MSKDAFNIGFINYLNDYKEFDYFVELMLCLEYQLCQNINLYIASSVPLRDDGMYLPDKFKSVQLFKDYKSDEFKQNLKSIDLGIVPSQLPNIMSLSSIEFLHNDIPIISGTIGGDSQLSNSELFRFNNKNDFYNKITNLINNPSLLTEYKKNYNELTQQFIKEAVMEDINPKVSIIVPFYNTDDYLEKCLNSLINQTLKDIEIILVDDGSTDHSLLTAKIYEQKDKRIKVIRQEHKKQGAARNTGMKAATGEYIGFVDSDDWVDLNYFEKLYYAAKKYNSDVALATNVRVGKKIQKKRLHIIEEKLYKTIEEKFSVCNQLQNECPTNKIYRTNYISKNNITWPEGCYCEDKLFTTQAVYYADSVVSVPDIYYYYFRNPNSTVNTKTKKHFSLLLDDKNNAKKSVLKFLREKNVKFVDKHYWATKKEIKFLNIPIFKIRESVFSEKYYLFSFIPFGGKTNEIH